REPFLGDPGFRKELHAYIAEVSKRIECPALEVGGTEDHVHMLVRFGRTIAVADWMKETKRVSSSFVKQRQLAFAWQAGYGVFSVCATDVDHVRAYIRGQEEHHRKFSFQDEFRKAMAEHGVEWDERYVWD
ncbi:MAG: REP-associated tyrosine transposase, partial [Fimbriimonadaceae bacterium]|nr:REP-associated tyrosine transposase [Fimbriimonadaceae bacterium]